MRLCPCGISAAARRWVTPASMLDPPLCLRHRLGDRSGSHCRQVTETSLYFIENRFQVWHRGSKARVYLIIPVIIRGISLSAAVTAGATCLTRVGGLGPQTRPRLENATAVASAAPNKRPRSDL